MILGMHLQYQHHTLLDFYNKRVIISQPGSNSLLFLIELTKKIYYHIICESWESD